MQQLKHAQQIAQRFRELVEEAGDSLPEQHYSELVLLIEAGLDTTMVENLEKIASQFDKISHSLRHDAKFFD